MILGSPALDGAGRIYVGTMEGALYCLRQDDGEFIWRFDAEGGLFSSPALDGAGRVYVASVTLPYVLDALTGALHWKFRTSAAIYLPAAAVRDGRPRVVFVGSTDWNCTRFEQTTVTCVESDARVTHAAELSAA